MDTDTLKGLALVAVIVWGGWGLVSSLTDDDQQHPQSSTSTAPSYNLTPKSTDRRSKPKNRCTDVTSYDYNWSNDMLCTRPDGSTFYTDYAGARAYEAQ